MSAVNEREITRIQDEDLLKKMWHETEDFGRKKEIRAHMYKLREERLKDLYCTSDVRDIHVISNKKGSFNQSMHADALADHSFASLKRKEIRDSESPTKEVSYRIKGSAGNEGWNISKIEERSEDGKSHKVSQSAHRSGTEYIPQGKLDYEAKNSQSVTSFQDGDDKNFIKSKGTSSNSYICQEAVGGDGNSNFRTSSTKSSTSSRTVTEQKSNYGDSIDYHPKQLVIEGVNNNVNISNSSKTQTQRKTSVNDAGDYQKKQIIIETLGGHNQNDIRSSSTNANTTSRTVTDQKSYDDYKKFSNISDDLIVDKTTKVYTTDAPRELKSHPGYVEGRTKVTRETKTLADGTVVTTTKYETKGSDEVKSASSNQYISSSSSHHDSKYNVTSKSKDEKFSTQKVIDDRYKTSKNQPTSRYYVEKTHTIPDATDSITYKIHTGKDSTITNTTNDQKTNVDQRYEVTSTHNVTQDRRESRNADNIRKHTIHHIENNDSNTQKTENIRKEVIDQTKVKQQKTVATHDVNSVPLGTPIEIEINLTRFNDKPDKNYPTKPVPSFVEAPKSETPVYDTPRRREPIKHESEMTTKTKVTDGQYDTTYRTDYTNKKISIEVSPTHDAFARSLRAVSPDRLTSRTNRNLKNSTSSLRSSSSPEKNYFDRKQPHRGSPEKYTNGRCRSPTRKTPEKFSSTETITYKRSPVQRPTSDHSQRRKNSTEIKLTTTCSTRKTEKLDERQSPKKRISIPNGAQNYTNVYEITTDLDDNSSTYSHSTTTRNKTESDSRTTKEFFLNEQKKNIDQQKMGSPKKDTPADRPLKRTDTYEERCRQILGITGDSNERRRSSLEKLRKKGLIQSPVDTPSKTAEELPSKKTPESPRQKSPSKTGKPLQEFPSQIRKTPEKFVPQDRTTERSPSGNRKSSVEGKHLQEFPSQNRRTPDKHVEQPSPTRVSPRKPSGDRSSPQYPETKKLQEFPSQIRKSPEKQPSPVRSSPKKPSEEQYVPETKKLQEFPSQVRRSPEKHPSLTRCSPKKPSEEDYVPEDKKLQEFPSQVRRSPEKRPSPTRSSPKKPSEEQNVPEDKKLQEFPSQIRRSPEKHSSPTRSSPTKEPSNRHTPEGQHIHEFPSQIRKNPEDQDTPRKSFPKNTETVKHDRRPSTQQKPEKISSPEEPETPTHLRSSISKTTLNEEDLNEKTITIDSTRIEDNTTDKNNTREYVVQDNIYVNIGSVKLDQYPDEKKSPKKVTSTFITKEKTEIERQTLNRPDSRKPILKTSKILKKPDDETSSEEDKIEEKEEQNLTEVIYDVPRKTQVGVDETKSSTKTINVYANTDKNEMNSMNVERKITDYVSEDEQPKNYQVNDVTYGRKTPGQDDTPLVPKHSPSTRKSPQKTTKTVNQDFISTEISQSKKQVQDSSDIQTLDQVEKTTQENIGLSRTVGELVKSFTNKGSEPTGNKKKPIEDKPAVGSPKKPIITQKTNSDIDDECSISITDEITISKETIKNLNDEEIVKSTEKYTPFKKTPTDKGVAPKPKKPEDVEVIEIDVTEVITTTSEGRKQTPSNKKTIQKPKDSHPSKNIEKTYQLTENGPLDSHQETDSEEEDNLIIIDIEENSIIDNEKVIDHKNKQTIKHFPTQSSVKKIVYVDEDRKVNDIYEGSEQELTEIEFATIKRRPHKNNSEPVEQKLNKSRMPKKTDKNISSTVKETTEKTNNRFVTKSTEQKRDQITRVENSVKDLKKTTQRTPSSSSLSKKPLVQQKISRFDDEENKKVVQTTRKSYDQKVTKPDSDKTKPRPDTKKPITQKPSETVNRKKPFEKRPVDDESDESSEAEEEIHTKKHVIETYEGRTPVEEPFILKKTVSLLYSDDEDDKKTTQLLIESEIVETQPITNEKKVKPTKSPKTTSTKLISIEKKENNITQKNRLPSNASPNTIGKKPVIEKKTVIPKKEKPKTMSKQNSLKDIEIFENTTVDKTVHLRSNRVDDTINRKKTSVVIENKKPTKKLSETTVLPKTSNRVVPNRQSSRNTITLEKTTNKNIIHTKESTKPLQKTIPLKSTKAVSKTTKTSNVKVNSEVINSKYKSTINKKEESENSDEESIPDSLNESVYSSINELNNTVQKIETETKSSENIKQTVYSRTQPTNLEEKPKQFKPTKKYVSTKSLDRGTVDLQRSISSREATPDKVCPLPVTSDDEGVAPRYPDKVVEPEENSTKRRYDKLFETSIHEYGDTIESKKIVEINDDQRVTGIDRVDNDDESLMTVDRKINKFLSTAEKLTEKHIVDISQPAPKVQRPKFEVNDDLKEDQCLLSVSDKVQKFITEAEHLTTQKDTQHRKSVNIDVKSDVSNRINQFTSPPQTNGPPRRASPEKEPKPSNRGEPGRVTTSSTIKLDQDVFITTECAEIEKESDMFRTPEQNIIRLTEEPIYDSPKPLNNKSPTKKPVLTSKVEDDDSQTKEGSIYASPKPSNTKSTTRKTILTQNEDVSIEETRTPEDTPSKPKGNNLKEFTPKNRRPSQEEKVILSSVGRLRSNESIKKAKAIFDTTESSTRDERIQVDILNRPSVFEGRNKSVKESNYKKIIDKNNVTPKRLDFTSGKESRERQTKVESNKRSSVEKDVPSYMKPLGRQQKPRDQTPEPREEYDRPKGTYPEQHKKMDAYTPGYMKPLDRSTTDQHPRDCNTPDSQDYRKHTVHKVDTHKHYTSNDKEDDIPGYMKPLDRSDIHHHSQTLLEHKQTPRHSDNDHHKNYDNEDDIPGYMKPLDRSLTHQHPRDSSTTDSQEYRKHSVHKDTHKHCKSNDEEDDIPGYMKPLDRSDIHHHFQTTQSQEHKHTHRHSDHHYENEDETPGYMKPLDRSIHHHPESSETYTSKHSISDSDTHKHYTSTDWTYNKQQYPYTSSAQNPQDHRPPRGSIPDEHSYSTDWKYKTRPNEDETPGYMKPLDRSSRPQFDSLDRPKSPESHTGGYPRQDTGEVPGYMKPLDRSARPEFEPLERSDSPDRSTREPKSECYEPSDDGVPGYMKPLDRSTKPQYDQRDRSKSPENTGKYRRPSNYNDKSSRSGSPQKEVPVEGKPRGVQGTPTKFGVTLKRTDSGRTITSSLTTDRKNSLLSRKSITEEEIDEIYDLELLEELLLKFTIYEIRRRIRTQIRIVKKLISEGKMEITIKNLRNKNTDQSLRTDNQSYDDRNKTVSRKTQETTTKRCNVTEKKNSVTEFTMESSRKESFSSTYTSERSEFRKSASPEKKIQERKSSTRTTPERASPERKLISKPNSERTVTTEETTYSQSIYSSKRPSTNVTKSSLKKTEPKVKTPESGSQPEWVTKRNLKKVGTNDVVKKSTVSSTSSTIKKQNTTVRNTDEIESTDLIASSYGIGPTDENGAPLFGLRALRAQNTNGTTKVQGTVISRQYYSESGKEPVGKISVTKYSSDPRDLGSNEDLAQNGDILSVTTTQKYGYDDAPSLKQLTKDKEICDSRTNRRKSSTKTSTITRKNSVKALTQKFVENAVEVSKNERQSSYPKAGLILRSSSFKNESETDDNNYSRVSAEERIEKSVSVKSSNSTSGGTFLRNKSKVTGVQDAIARMRSEDIEYGDTEDDVQAKDLLNKYLGSQVILSGIEGHMSKTGTSSSSSFTNAAKSTSRITTVTMENGKEVTKTRTFEHPLSQKVLETVWDEQTLRYLLDQSTDYEERKLIRARLRVIMAEQEACTELVKQASQDQSSQSIDENIVTSKEIVSDGPVSTTKVTRVSTQQHISKKPISPFAKFRQLDKQNSLNTPPSTPRTPGGSPLFKFTDAALSQSASTIKDRLLYWCRMKTKEYENIQLDNFSTSWADGLAFCALIHHFLPDAFDYHALTPKERRHNFTLAFKVADEKADIAPLLDVDDMVATSRPDWKCVFTYVQSIYRRFKDED